MEIPFFERYHPNSNKNNQYYCNSNSSHYDKQMIEKQLKFSVLLSKFKQPIFLILSLDKYSDQIRSFVKKYQLTKQQTIALKQIIKAKIKQLAKENSYLNSQQNLSNQQDLNSQLQSSSLYNQNIKQDYPKKDRISPKQKKKFQTALKNHQTLPYSINFRDDSEISSISEEKEPEDYKLSFKKDCYYQIDPAQYASFRNALQNNNFSNCSVKVSKKSSGQRSRQKYKKYFVLNSKKKNQTHLAKEQVFTSPKIKKTAGMTHKIPQSAQNQKFIPKSSSKAFKTNSQKKSSPEQKLINQEVFHRLYQYNTSSFRFKQKPENQKSIKQLEDEKIVDSFLQRQKQKSNQMSPAEKQNLFLKLYQTSTESSMNKKYDSNTKNQSYRNQIECVIKESAKKAKSKSPFFKQKFKPNMQSSVYAGTINKRCNAHCFQFEIEKKQEEQRQNLLKKEKLHREEIRKRSKSSSPSLQSTSNPKRSGQCPCCHKERLQQKQALRLIESKTKRKEENQRPKYSIQKYFLPKNISFMSDILQQSYKQLFPGQ